MTTPRLLGETLMISMMIATPAFAQEAIQEPCAFAFYHPDVDALNGGRPAPAEDADTMAAIPGTAANAYAMYGYAPASSCAQRYHSYDPATGTFLGYDGQRHVCE